MYGFTVLALCLEMEVSATLGAMVQDVTYMERVVRPVMMRLVFFFFKKTSFGKRRV